MTYTTFEKILREKNLKKKLSQKKISSQLIIKLSKFLNINFNYFFPQIPLKNTIIKKEKETLKYSFPEKKNEAIIRDILNFEYLSGCKMFEINLKKNKTSATYESSKHQYIYVLNDNLKINIKNKIKRLKEGDSLYVRPFEKYKLSGRGGSALIIRLEGNLSDQIMFELSKINKKDIERVVNEKENGSNKKTVYWL